MAKKLCDTTGLFGKNRKRLGKTAHPRQANRLENLNGGGVLNSLQSISLQGVDRSRSSPLVTHDSSTSQPTKRRPRLRQATAVVKLPPHGSTTKSPGSEK